MKRYLILMACWCGLAAGCHRQPAAQVTAGAYFDLKRYMQAEIERLQAKDWTLSKTIDLNGESETRQIRQADIAAELAPFLDVAISRPAWHGRFQADTLRHGFDYAIVYKCQQSDIPVKELVISWSGDRVQRVEALRAFHSLPADFTQRLRYTPDSGYVIEAVQNMLGQKTLLKAEVAFIH